HHHAIGGDLDLRLGRGHELAHRDRWHDLFVGILGRELFRIDVTLGWPNGGLVSAACRGDCEKDHNQRRKAAAVEYATARGAVSERPLRCSIACRSLPPPITHSQFL